MESPPCDSNNLLDNMLFQEIQSTYNPYLTMETLILRLSRRISDHYQIPFHIIINRIRKCNCFLDPTLQNSLYIMSRDKTFTIDEQHCIERLLGHDFVRQTDLLKLAGFSSKFADQALVWKFFAVDGYLGSNPKQYIPDSFSTDDFKRKHAEGVRYMYEELNLPNEIKEALEVIFDGKCENHAYVQIVGGMEIVKHIAEWRRDLQKKFESKKI